MANIRSVNRRHKRAIAHLARNKRAEVTAPVAAEPVKAAS